MAIYILTQFTVVCGFWYFIVCSKSVILSFTPIFLLLFFILSIIYLFCMAFSHVETCHINKVKFF